MSWINEPAADSLQLEDERTLLNYSSRVLDLHKRGLMLLWFATLCKGARPQSKKGWKFSLCLYLVSIVQLHSLLFGLFSASGTCGTTVLTAPLTVVEVHVPLSLVWLVFSHEHNAYALVQAIRV